jgi:hypothetical protein
MDKAFIGYGTTFERGSGSPLGYDEIARVSEITPPGVSRDAVDVTHLKSADRYKEFISGMRDGGEVTFTIIYNPEETTHALLEGDLADDELHPYRVKFPNDLAHAWDFNGFITGFKPAAPMADKVTAAVTVRISGKPTFAATVSP